MVVFGQLLPGLGDPIPDLGHGGQDAGRPLSGASRARLLALGSSMLTLSRSASRPSCWVRRGSAPGMAFGVDIAAEAIILAEQAQCLDHPLGGIIRVPQHGGGEKEPLNIVAAVELDGEFGQLPGSKKQPGADRWTGG